MKLKKELFIAIFLGGSFAFAADPSIHFQGRLTDAKGRPIAGDQNRVKFSIFPADPTAGSLWDGPEQNVVSNEAGLFTAEIGPIPQNIFSQTDLSLQVKVFSNGEFKPLLPRQKLSTVPFAIHAEYAANTAPEYRIPSGMIAMFAQACPSGWTRFERLDNRVAVGTPTYTGFLGGNSDVILSTAGAHSHIVNNHNHATPDHMHPLDVSSGLTRVTESFPIFAGPNAGLVAVTRSVVGGGDVGIPNAVKRQTTVSGSGVTGNAAPGTDVQGDHTHSVISDGAWMPLNLGIVFCEKN